MALRLNGATSGYVEIDAPATAGSNTLVLPNGNGTNGQYLQTNGSGGLSWQTVTVPDSVNWNVIGSVSLSGASTTISGIPADAQMVIVSWENASDTAGNGLEIRMGTSTAISSTNYEATDGYYGGGSNGTIYSRTTHFTFGGAGMGASNYDGRMILTRLDNSNQRWYVEGSERQINSAYWFFCTGSFTLTAALERVQLSVPTGSLDDGTVSVYYLA